MLNKIGSFVVFACLFCHCVEAQIAQYRLAAGNPSGTANFSGDNYVTGGTGNQTPSAVNTSNITTAAYSSLYQSERVGTFTYTLPNLTAGQKYALTLHFAEIDGNTTGQRLFNVAVNGTTELSNFDIYAESGGPLMGLVKNFTVVANSSGQIVIVFSSTGTGVPSLAGIEVYTIAPASSATPTANAVIQIDSGNNTTVGTFSSDTSYSGGGPPLTTNATIDTSAVNNPAPQAVYTTERAGSSFSYGLGNLSPGQVYTVRLHFAEIVYSAPTQREFNVSVGGNPVLTNFDIVAEAGGPNIAIVKTFLATANNYGSISVAFSSGAADMPAIAAIEAIAGFQINCGSVGVGTYQADEYYNGGGDGQTTYTIDTSHITGATAAPQPVYQTERYGFVTYTFPNLHPGTTYQLNLHFAEFIYSSPGQRQFNVAVNGVPTLSNFDIVAEAGASLRAIVVPLQVTATSAGQVTVYFSAGASDGPKVSGIELLAAGSSPTQFMLSGTITKQGSPLRGVTVTLSGTQNATVTTGSDGTYQFTVTSGGSYVVTPSLLNYSFTASSQNEPNVSASQSGINFVANAAAGGTLNPSFPLKEYIYLNGQVIAIENP